MLTGIGVVITAALTFALKYMARTYKIGKFLEDMPSSDNDPVVPVFLPKPVLPIENLPNLPVAPSKTPEVPPQPPQDKLTLFCKAHEHFEGYSLGTTAFIHRNPGNLKNKDGSWQTFPTYEAGFAALKAYVVRVATGKHPAYPKGGNTSIKEYVSIYAPDGPVIIANYAKALSTAVGTTPDQKMSWLLS